MASCAQSPNGKVLGLAAIALLSLLLIPAQLLMSSYVNDKRTPLSDDATNIPDSNPSDVGRIVRQEAPDDGRRNDGSAEQNNKTRIVLFWSRRAENRNMKPYDRFKTGMRHFRKCEWTNCELSRDRERAPEATVVVYGPADSLPTWPEVRFANQTYVHMLTDRPGLHWWLPRFDGKINLTWNYRRDADISYHVVVRRKDNASEDRYVPRIPLANRTRSVVWAVSHCATGSKREDYVAELSKYIDVDVYGQCGSLECSSKNQTMCTERWERGYKFYLSFENSICKDYITEKFYRTLRLDLIPVVLGGGDYETAGPPHSYINVMDYRSPKHLAGYLRRLGADEQAYYEYFQWKRSYTFGLSLRKICKLCEVAHNMEKWARPAWENYSEWWTSKCDNEFVERMRSEGNW